MSLVRNKLEWSWVQLIMDLLGGWNQNHTVKQLQLSNVKSVLNLGND